MPTLDKDTKLCISLAGRPSNLGTRFHNYLYDELGLNFAYKAFTTDDIEGAIRGVRALGIRGCSVSMPFKEAVIPLVDEIEPSAAVIESVNTIVNTDGHLVGANTDYEAIATLIVDNRLDVGLPVVVRGSGGMAKAVVAALRDHHFEDVTVLARNPALGPELADRYGYRWTPDEPAPGAAQVLINVTPLGMQGADSEVLSFPRDLIEAASIVFDVVAFPAETPLIHTARELNKTVISGADVHANQAARQFERYTGVSITREQVARAAEYSRR
ncbi:MAG: shikimate 5-dehydrogenase [Nocardiaceae bacterium]|nr:shikimate 5-dehydrogenase [Nocardiaceae bacterium]